jgi:aminopeptidase N
VDDIAGLGFALENQTRPIYAKDFFTDTQSGDSVIVHELAHQWYGDSLAVEEWKNIWLNEGFATYAEWMWSEHDGLGTAQEIFDFYYAVIPEDDPFWSVVIGDPGPDLMFDIAVYYRGAMTLHQLRLAVGERDFFRILRTWAQTRRGDNVEIPEFIRLAEKISREDLDELFDTWLYTDTKPELSSSTAARRMSAASGLTASERVAALERFRHAKH